MFIVKSINSDKSQVSTNGFLPSKRGFSSSVQPINMIIFDDRRQISTIIDYKYSLIGDKSLPTECDIIVLGNDDQNDEISIKEIIGRIRNTYDINIKSQKYINLLKLYQNSVKINNPLNIQLQCYHDSYKIGLSFLCTSTLDEFKYANPLKFLSYFTNINLDSSTLKETLKEWITETQKHHNFITNSENINKFYEFREYLINEHHVNLMTIFSKSYLKSFKTMVSNIDLEKYKIYYNDLTKQTIYHNIVQNLLKLAEYDFKYNISYFKLSGTSFNKKITISFLGNSFTISNNNGIGVSLIAYLDTCGELNNLEMNIERTILLNS